MEAMGLLIDYELCTGCQSCEVSCKEEHDYPVGKWGIRVFDDGPWEIEPGHYNWNKIPVPTDLCDLCAERVSEGKDPRCVHHCLAQCMELVKVEDISKKMAEHGKKVTCYIP